MCAWLATACQGSSAFKAWSCARARQVFMAGTPVDDCAVSQGKIVQLSNGAASTCCSVTQTCNRAVLLERDSPSFLVVHCFNRCVHLVAGHNVRVTFRLPSHKTSGLENYSSLL